MVRIPYLGRFFKQIPYPGEIFQQDPDPEEDGQSRILGQFLSKCRIPDGIMGQSRITST